MTSTDHHYGLPSNDAELLGATHTWRAVLRQAAAHLSLIAGQPGERSTRVAVEDVVTHLEQACALLTTIDASLDLGLTEARRAHSRTALANRMRHHRDEGSTDAVLA